MTLSISISPDMEHKLRERAALEGKAPEAYAADLLLRDLTRPSLEALLEPVWEDFARSGLTEAQIMDLGRKELEALRGEDRAGST